MNKNSIIEIEKYKNIYHLKVKKYADNAFLIDTFAEQIMSCKTALKNEEKKIISENINSNDVNSSCGPNSGWKYCAENNAIVVGLGIDLVHSLTIMHVAEENHDNWYKVFNFFYLIDKIIYNNHSISTC